jgi:hypothetical protein
LFEILRTTVPTVHGEPARRANNQRAARDIGIPYSVLGTFQGNAQPSTLTPTMPWCAANNMTLS